MGYSNTKYFSLGVRQQKRLGLGNHLSKFYRT